MFAIRVRSEGPAHHPLSSLLGHLLLHLAQSVRNDIGFVVDPVERRQVVIQNIHHRSQRVFVVFERLVRPIQLRYLCLQPLIERVQILIDRFGQTIDALPRHVLLALSSKLPLQPIVRVGTHSQSRRRLQVLLQRLDDRAEVDLLRSNPLQIRIECPLRILQIAHFAL